MAIVEQTTVVLERKLQMLSKGERFETTRVLRQGKVEEATQYDLGAFTLETYSPAVVRN